MTKCFLSQLFVKLGGRGGVDAETHVPGDYRVVNSNWNVNHVCVICGDWPLFVNWHAEIILKWLI